MSALTSITPLRLTLIISTLLFVGVAATGGAQNAADSAEQSGPLRGVASFNSIADRKARSAALFIEAGKVITSPRCMNCHPATRRPTQGDDLHPHNPPMAAHEGMGPTGLACTTCHGPENVSTRDPNMRSIPGDPHWMLAPESMAWQGKTLGEICRQIKDPALNGDRSLAEIHTHMAEDHLVGWAWRPGPGRKPAHGTQAGFGQLIKAWIDTGAQCPA